MRIDLESSKRGWRVRGACAVWLVGLLWTSACTVERGRPGGEVSSAGKTQARDAAIGDTLRRLIADAYDFSQPNVPARLMALYPDTGAVVSAMAGHITTARDSLAMAIQSFWMNIGRNMQEPRWVWGPTYVEVVSADAAVLTGTYSIPHRAPNGQPHVVGGAWTALFERRGGRWAIVQEHLSDPGVAMGTMEHDAPATPGRGRR